MITESQIKAAIRRVTAGELRIELRDGGPRGAGRLVLVVRKIGNAATPTSEFHAAWHRGGKRFVSKLASYPVLSLAEARKRFREEFAPTISAGGEPASTLRSHSGGIAFAAGRGISVSAAFLGHVRTGKPADLSRFHGGVALG
jgi:hypothetical protein